ncbi:MAG: low-specificity L-threonine aldolase [Acidiferrobacterales bacterium]|nr:low-specificity L-threonine aldolase [Acidiferrobacterales bacterium]
MSIDFRSDTVTKPTEAMRKAMYRAEVGDDVYGEDSTINRLEETMAERFGMEAGVFVTSGTQGNLLALMAHCSRGDEYIVGQLAHTYKYEGGGGAVLGSIQPQPLDFAEDGSIDLELARRAIKPDDDHFANTRLFCLENTQAGRALSMAYLDAAQQFVQSTRLAFHLDGARVFNAAIFHDVEVDRITGRFDSVSCCFSKGLGAPVGSILCGDRETIRAARRWRKLVGGGLRQGGVIAAAALYAVENHVERLRDDHDNARWIAQQLSEVDGIDVIFHPMQTNMVFVTIRDGRVQELAEFLRGCDIIVTPGEPMRLVTHLDVDRDAAIRLVDAVRTFMSKSHVQTTTSVSAHAPSYGFSNDT